MITWLQNATGKHHRLIFGFLLVIIVVSFVFYGFAGRGALKGSGSYMYLGVDLNDPSVRLRHRDAQFFANMTGQRMDNVSLQQRVAELSLANSLNIPDPSEAEIRKIAKDATMPPDGKAEGDTLGKFIDFASKQLNASDLETRAWRINKAMTILSGGGHATAAQVKRILDRERAKWTVDAATLPAANFKATIADDEAKAKASFEANKESYRLPAKVEVSAVTITDVTPDTSPISDDDVVTFGYNVAEKFKFETGKVKEQALARRGEIEKLIRAERAVTNLAGLISDELSEKFAVDATKADNQGFAAWLKAKKATITALPAYDAGSPPVNDKVPAEALRAGGDLTEKEWRTDVYRTEQGAVFVLLNKRAESRLPEFAEVKALALSNWKATERSRLLTEEVGRLNKALLADQAAGKSFTESAKALGLTVSSPAAFTAFTVPENLTGVTENTGQLIEVAGVGKITAPIRTRNGDYVFLRPAKSEVPKDDSTAEETKLFVQRISGRNAYFTSMGLIQDLTAPPEPEAAK
ncbi:MAG: hypothetical protein EBS64_03415 [Verrucomicrobia bacterium]|nr:hypothetical protein [Verrucomicrobiota bacterium]